MEQQPSGGGSGVARSANAVYIVPADWGAAPAALATAIDRVDADVGATQLIVVVASADAAVAITQAISGVRGQTIPRVVAATGASRVARILRAGAAPIVVGAPEQLLALMRMSALKLDGVRVLAVAWLEDILAAGRGEDLEAVMSEVPKSAGRVLLTARRDPSAEDFVERHARRAPVLQLAPADPQLVGDRTGVTTTPALAPEVPVTVSSVGYVTCPVSARSLALQTVLDELDPPSALIYVRSNDGEREVQETLRALGYDAHHAIRLTHGAVNEHTALVILFDLPQTAAEWRAATSSQPARVVALVTPRLMGQLRALAGVAIAPLTFSAPVDAARASEAQLRAALRRELAAGTPARELLTLEPLLSEFDGAALAAAALRLLEHERTNRARAEPAAVAAPPSQVAPQERSQDRGRERPRHDQGARNARGGPGGGRSHGGDRSGRSSSPSGGGGRGEFRGRPNEQPGGPPRGAPHCESRRPPNARPLPRNPR